jgi:hypothetical protein
VIGDIRLEDGPYKSLADTNSRSTIGACPQVDPNND